jgi:hypothetical protein
MRNSLFRANLDKLVMVGQLNLFLPLMAKKKKPIEDFRYSGRVGLIKKKNNHHLAQG